MIDIIILAIIGSALAWAMLPPAIHPDVARRLRALPRRQTRQHQATPLDRPGRLRRASIVQR